MDFLGLIFGFLHFYRRLIIGFLLLVALGYFLLIRLPDRNQRTESLREVSTPERSRPTTRVEPSSVSPADDLSGSTDSNSAVASIGNPDEKDDANPPAAVTEPDTRSDEVDQASKFSKLFRTGSVDELINESLVIAEKSQKAQPMVQFSFLKDRKDIATELLKRDLNPTQRRFAVRSYIETVSMMDVVNTQMHLRMDSIDAELHSNVASYLDDSDEDVSSLAALAMVVSAATKFFEEASAEGLSELKTQVDLHFDRIVENMKNAQKLAELSYAIHRQPKLGEPAKQFVKEILARFESNPIGSNQKIALALKQAILFGAIDTPTLVERINENSLAVDKDIEAFIGALESYPDATIEIYQVAMNVIRELIKVEKQDRARQLIERLEQKILPRMISEANRTAIQDAINELKEFL